MTSVIVDLRGLGPVAAVFDGQLVKPIPGAKLIECLAHRVVKVQPQKARNAYDGAKSVYGAGLCRRVSLAHLSPAVDSEWKEKSPPSAGSFTTDTISAAAWRGDCLYV